MEFALLPTKLNTIDVIDSATIFIQTKFAGPAACKLENIGDLSFFRQQDTVVS